MIHLGFINFITYFFLLVTVFAAVMVVIKKHPVHAVLSLIVTFCAGAVLLLINNAEFLALLILTVYVGAVMVLFLFVVMMIDVDTIQYIKNSWYEKLSIVTVSAILFIILFVCCKNEISSKRKLMASVAELSMRSNDIELNNNQPRELGKIIYNEENSIFVIIASLILFVGIIGAITLTLRERNGLKKQNLFTQLLRSRENSLEVKKIPFGSGVSDE